MSDQDEEILRWAEFAGLPDGTPDEIVARLITGLSEDKRTAENMANALVMIGPATEAVIPGLIDNLNHDERAAAAMRSALIRIGDEALRQLLQRLPDSKVGHTQQIILTIGQFRGAGQLAADTLRHCLQATCPSTRVAAAIALSMIEGDSAEWTIEIARAYTVGIDENLMGKASEMIETLGTRAAVALPLIVMGLVRQDPFFGRNAAYLLGRMGHRAIPAIPALLKAKYDPEQHPDDLYGTRLAASAALESIAIALRKRGQLTDSLAEALSCDSSKGILGCSALVANGTHAIDQLEDWLNDSDSDMRIGSMIALGCFGPAAERVLPRTSRFLELESLDERIHASIVCWQISGRATNCASLGLQFLRQKRGLWSTKKWVAKALRDIGQVDCETLAELLEILRNPDEHELKEYAITIVTGTGIGGAAAVPLLQVIMQEPQADDSNEEYRRSQMRQTAERACAHFYALVTLGELLRQACDPTYQPFDPPDEHLQSEVRF